MKNNILKIINEKYSIGYSKIKCPKSEHFGMRHSFFGRCPIFFGENRSSPPPKMARTPMGLTRCMCVVQEKMRHIPGDSARPVLTWCRRCTTAGAYMDALHSVTITRNWPSTSRLHAAACVSLRSLLTSFASGTTTRVQQSLYGYTLTGTPLAPANPGTPILPYSHITITNTVQHHQQWKARSLAAAQ